MSEANTSIDLLCVAPHTDDAEIAIGAALRLLADCGRRIWICDLSRGELASNATPQERWVEAAEASQLLGLAGRWQLGLPDGAISAADPAQVAAVTAVIRMLRPRWLVCAPAPERHPDHLATPALVQKAAFMADLINFKPKRPRLRGWPDDPGTVEMAPRWRCEARFEVCPVEASPSLIFDCSQTWSVKLEALACYRSQFSRDADRQPTAINDAAFMDRIEQIGKRWGLRAGTAYGEALRTAAVPVLTDLPREGWS